MSRLIVRYVGECVCSNDESVRTAVMLCILRPFPSQALPVIQQQVDVNCHEFYRLTVSVAKVHYLETVVFHTKLISPWLYAPTVSCIGINVLFQSQVCYQCIG